MFDLLLYHHPQNSIYSCNKDSDAGYMFLSGTSMAAPVVAGSIACVLGNSVGKTCKLSDIMRKITNGRVNVAQPKTNPARPFVYMPSDFNESC